jgi:hypothetical protein
MSPGLRTSTPRSPRWSGADWPAWGSGRGAAGGVPSGGVGSSARAQGAGPGGQGRARRGPGPAGHQTPQRGDLPQVGRHVFAIRTSNAPADAVRAIGASCVRPRAPRFPAGRPTHRSSTKWGGRPAIIAVRAPHPAGKIALGSLDPKRDPPAWPNGQPRVGTAAGTAARHPSPAPATKGHPRARQWSRTPSRGHAAPPRRPRRRRAGRRLTDSRAEDPGGPGPLHRYGANLDISSTNGRVGSGVSS